MLDTYLTFLTCHNPKNICTVHSLLKATFGMIYGHRSCTGTSLFKIIFGKTVNWSQSLDGQPMFFQSTTPVHVDTSQVVLSVKVDFTPVVLRPNFYPHGYESNHYIYLKFQRRCSKFEEVIQTFYKFLCPDYYT